MKEAACAILFSYDKKEVLLIERRDVPVWALPGGGIEEGESPETAACREMKEETGFDVKIIRKVAEYTPPNRLSGFTHFFEVAAVGGTAGASDEARSVRFFPLDALPKRLAPPYPYWIKDALAQHEGVLHKKVEGTSYWNFVKLLFQHPILVFRFLLTRIGIHINSR